MELKRRMYIAQLCKECEDLLSEMCETEKFDGDAIDCCYRRLYLIRYIVAPFWKKSKLYKE